MKRAFITGIAGQDGSYLAELLLGKGYEVFGSTRSGGLPADLREPLRNIRVQTLAAHEPEAVTEMVRQVRPDEIYHLAAHHHSSSGTGDGFDPPLPYIQTNLTAAANIVTAVARDRPECRVFLASSCHIFGDSRESPQTERTPLNPINPYGITKAAAFRLGRLYRETRGLHVSTGILYNHESPRRKESFLPARIAATAARIAGGSDEVLTVGNLGAQVDWGSAQDYVKAMWLMLQAPRADDYIIATGVSHTPEEFIREAFALLGLEFDRHVKAAPDSFRPVSATVYRGDRTKITEALGWQPETSFRELVRAMVEGRRKAGPA